MVTLVLLPGLDGTGLLFEQFIAAFTPQFEIIVVSYPTNTVLDYAQLTAHTLNHLPKKQPFFLLGESFSGPIAINIAATNPPGLKGLILCCSFARNPRPLLSLLRPLLGIAPVTALPMAVLSYFVLGRYASAALRQALAQSLSQVTPAALRARAHAALSVDVTPSLSHIKVPLLYLRATQDRVVPESAYRLLLARMPQIQIEAFAAPHFLLQVHPLQTARIVTMFIENQPP